MPRSFVRFVSALAMSAAATAAPIAYPPTERGPVVEQHFGEAVADPYRWLENDVRADPKVKAWVEAENGLTRSFLDALPGRAAIAARLKALWNYERVGVPLKRGGRYFFLKNSGLQNQSVLYVRDSLTGPDRLLIDPNAWATDGATALAEWEPSRDGTHLVYAVQDGGTDWRTLRVLDVATGNVLPDEVHWAKFSNLGWDAAGRGFFYSRFPEPKAAAEYQTLNLDHQVFYHALGTPQSADRLVFSTPAQPKLNHDATTTRDGRWLFIKSSEGTDDRYQVTVVDLAAPDWKPRTIIKGFDNNWSLAGNDGATFYLVTDKDAPRQKIVAMDAAAATATPREIVPEGPSKLDSASLVGARLIASYLVDAKSEAKLFALDGKPVGTVPIPAIGSVDGFDGQAGDPETFFSFTSYNYPTWILRYDSAHNRAIVFAKPKVAFDPEDYKVDQVFYTSKDGTRVPMFVVRRKDAKGPVPTILYGYGGFNISLTPGFSPAVLGWVEMGGAYAVANIRGGGEYGKAWHDAGRLAHKQNVFDDFIAAGEYLKSAGIAAKDGLVINGGSNGGLLIGAVTNQRPDLFAAALPEVGVMDMLRFDQFTAGRYWTDDYGFPEKQADYGTLRTYSPYQNVRSGAAYPAILVMTADTDDRVVPGHSFKYAAALQHADIGDKPHLIRIETRAGHGSGKPTDKKIAEYADMWAFAARWSGLKVPE